ncbi:MAG: MFS transporter [Eubacteriaceae bacterium]|nr:MFS transporter [Eubacteriaceae bacterium]
MEQNRNSIWTRNFTLLFTVNFIMSLGVQFLQPTMPLYAMGSLGASQSQVGYLLGAYSFAALLIRPFAGYAYDYIGRKKTYVIALAVFTFVTFGYPFLSSFLMLVVLRFLHGISFGITSTGGGTIAGDIIPESRRGEGVGYFGLANTLSTALGPAIGIWIMGNNKFSYLFAASSALIFMALVLSNFLRLPTHAKPLKPPTFSSFFEKRVVPISMLVLLSCIITGGILTYIIIFSKEIGVVNGGIYFMVNSVGIMITRLYAGKITDRKGPGAVLSFGFLAQAIGYILLSFSSGLFSFAAAALVIGIGTGTIFPALQTMVINVVEPECRGVANSTYFAAIDIGIGGGSIFIGWLAGSMPLHTIFLLSGIFCLVPLALSKFYVLKDYENKVLMIKEKKTKIAFVPKPILCNCKK